MNRKGQSLVLFVLLLPLVVMIFALIFDSALIVMEHTKLKNIADDALNNIIVKDKDISLVRQIIFENDRDIEIKKISVTEIHLMKHIDSYFGKVVGYDTYELEVDYTGYLENGVLRIKEKGI